MMVLCIYAIEGKLKGKKMKIKIRGQVEADNIQDVYDGLVETGFVGSLNIHIAPKVALHGANGIASGYAKYLETFGKNTTQTIKARPIVESVEDISSEKEYPAPLVAFSLGKGMHAVCVLNPFTNAVEDVGNLYIEDDRVYRYDVHDFQYFDHDGNPISIAIGIATVEPQGIVNIVSPSGVVLEDKLHNKRHTNEYGQTTYRIERIDKTAAS
jgi:hypothetical protein